jgi:predicted nucleic acid-binding protein
MARNVLVDAGFVVALLSKRDTYHAWAASQACDFPPPWSTCEAALSEAYHLLGERGAPGIGAMLRRRALDISFQVAEHLEPVTKLIEKYSNIPMSLANACLVRMTEIFADPIILTTDRDFRIYRRHSRQVIPCVTPE